MKTFAERKAEDRRLVILRLLAQSEDYSANLYLLHMALPDFGYTSPEEAIRADLAWLEQSKLVTIRELAGIVIARLTNRGDDVQSGRLHVNGVKRSRPE